MQKLGTINLTKIMLLLLAVVGCTGQSLFVSYNMTICYVATLLGVIILIIRKKIEKIEGIHIWFLLVTLYIGGSILTSKFSIQTTAYFRLFLCIELVFLIGLKEEYKLYFINLCKGLASIVAISIIMEVIIPNLFTEYFWFIATPKHDMGVLATLSKNIARGYYSGFACEKSAAAYIMNIGLACIGAEYFTNEKMKKINYIWAMLYLVGILLTGKRMLLAIPIVIYIIALLSLKKKNKITTIVGSIILGIAIFYIASNAIPQLGVTFQRFSMYEDDTLRGRDNLWLYALALFKTYPFFGVGYGAYNKMASMWGLTTGDGIAWSTNAHNIYYQLLAETGIIGTCLFVFLFVMGIVTTIKKIKMFNRNDYKQILLFSLFVQMITLLYGLTGNPIYTVNELIMYGISLTFIAKCTLEKK